MAYIRIDKLGSHSINYYKKGTRKMNFFRLNNRRNNTVATGLSEADIKSIHPNAKKITGIEFYNSKTNDADYDPEEAAVIEYLNRI